MKLLINKITLFGLSIYTMFTVFAVQGCDDDEKQKAVDLRYRVEDSYSVPANGTEEELSVKFQVKSSDPWEVFGESKKNWYTITPATGDAGKIFDVVVKCKENTELDDRTEVVHIKSDYWTGKKFTITQKGIAFLNYAGVDIIAKDGNTPEEFDVLTNQKWTAEVVDGTEWLSITQGASGEGNGTITLSARANSGAMRYGTVALYDRYGVKQQDVAITQDGVQLEPAQPSNTKWYEVESKGSELRIPVVANSRWRISKTVPEDETWYSFEKTEFNGSDEIVVLIDEYDSNSSVRNGTILLSSVSDEEDVEPVTTTIRFKQASSEASRTTVNEINETVNGEKYFGSSLLPGRYSVYIGALPGDMNLFFMINGSVWTEFRYHIVGGKTELSTTPWSKKVFGGAAGTVYTIDTKADNKLTFNILEETNDAGKWIRVEWYLNDKFLVSTISDGTEDWKVPSTDLVTKGGQMLIKGQGIPFHKWEYIEPLNWGE